jgi:hypothetical protein
VVYGSTSLVGFVLLPLLMAALNPFVTSRAAVPYLAGAVLSAGMVVVSFFGHKQYTFAQGTIGDQESKVAEKCVSPAPGRGEA